LTPGMWVGKKDKKLYVQTIWVKKKPAPGMWVGKKDKKLYVQTIWVKKKPAGLI